MVSKLKGFGIGIKTIAPCVIAPEQIASVVYEAATDGKDQLRYVAGEDVPLPATACTLPPMACPRPTECSYPLKKMSPASPGFKVKNFLM